MMVCVCVYIFGRREFAFVTVDDDGVVVLFGCHFCPMRGSHGGGLICGVGKSYAFPFDDLASPDDPKMMSRVCGDL